MNDGTPLRFGLSALALFGVLLAACSSPSPVDEVVASNLAARGGEARIRALRSIRETGTATGSGGRVARVVRELKRPGLMRLQLTYQGTTSVFAFDGERSWQVAPLQGQFEPRVTPPESEATADQRDIEGPLLAGGRRGISSSSSGVRGCPAGMRSSSR